MDDKLTNTVNNIMTLIGAACLAYPIINECAQAIAPQLENLSSGEHVQKLLTDGAEQKDDKQKDAKDGHDEIAELKEKLAKYEEQHKSEGENE